MKTALIEYKGILKETDDGYELFNDTAYLFGAEANLISHSLSLTYV